MFDIKEEGEEADLEEEVFWLDLLGVTLEDAAGEIPSPSSPNLVADFICAAVYKDMLTHYVSAEDTFIAFEAGHVSGFNKNHQRRHP